MTRKDYIAVAAVFKAKRPVSWHSTPVMDGPEWMRWLAAMDTWQAVVDATADVFKADNPAFDHRIFRIACGMEER